MRKRVSAYIAAVLLSLSVIGLCAPRAFGTTTITFGFPWGHGHPFLEGLEEAIKAFEAEHPDIKVEVEPGYTNDKLRVAVASGLAPDVYQEGVGNVIPNSVAGMFMPLDSYIERYNIVLDEEFIPAVLPLLRWEGKTYALHWVADVNFAFFRNHEILESAGFDASADINYIDEVEEIIQKTTRTNPNGTVEQVGLVPWAAGDLANGLLTWGLAFGGSFYDLEAQEFTTDHPRNIEALEWMQSFLVRGWWAPGAPTSLDTRQVATGLAWPTAVGHIRNVHPDLQFSLGPIPHKREGGNPNPVWVAGPSLTIPVGSKNPDAAFELINFLVRDPVGSSLFARTANAFPANRNSVYLAELAEDPEWRPFFQQSLAIRFSRPPVPNSSYWIQAGNAAVNRTLWENVDAARSLIQMQFDVTTNLRELLSSFGR